MTRQEALERMGGRKNAIIGGVSGCLVFVLGGCGLLLGGVGWLGGELVHRPPPPQSVAGDASVTDVGKVSSQLAASLFNSRIFKQFSQAFHVRS